MRQPTDHLLLIMNFVEGCASSLTAFEIVLLRAPPPPHLFPQKIFVSLLCSVFYDGKLTLERLMMISGRLLMIIICYSSMLTVISKTWSASSYWHDCSRSAKGNKETGLLSEIRDAMDLIPLTVLWEFISQRWYFLGYFFSLLTVIIMIPERLEVIHVMRLALLNVIENMEYFGFTPSDQASGVTCAKYISLNYFPSRVLIRSLITALLICLQSVWDKLFVICHGNHSFDVSCSNIISYNAEFM